MAMLLPSKPAYKIYRPNDVWTSHGYCTVPEAMILDRLYLSEIRLRKFGRHLLDLRSVLLEEDPSGKAQLDMEYYNYLKEIFERVDTVIPSAQSAFSRNLRIDSRYSMEMVEWFERLQDGKEGAEKVLEFIKANKCRLEKKRPAWKPRLAGRIVRSWQGRKWSTEEGWKLMETLCAREF